MVIIAILFYLATAYRVYYKHSCMKNNSQKLNIVHHILYKYIFLLIDSRICRQRLVAYLKWCFIVNNNMILSKENMS
jgi:hypothetical protein